MFLGINKQQLTCSILVGNFDTKLSNWSPSDKDNKVGQDIDTLTAASGYIQMNGQPTHIINDKLSCIDLLFTNNNKLLSEVGVEQTTYDKCNHKIICGLLILTNLFFHLTIRKFWITKTQIRYV